MNSNIINTVEIDLQNTVGAPTFSPKLPKV